MTDNKPVEHKSTIAHLTALVGGFALLSSTLLSLGDLVTKDVIDLRRAEDLKSLLAQVVPPEIHDNDLPSDTIEFAPNELSEDELVVFRARQKDKVHAVAYETSVPGYAGPIVLVMGVDRNGSILGVRVISHTETPGLGDKIEINKSDWLLSFNGRSLSNTNAEGWAVKKDGGEFDQFTGATITPRRAIKAVHRGLEFFDKYRLELLDEQSEAEQAFAEDMNSDTGPIKTLMAATLSVSSAGFTLSADALMKAIPTPVMAIPNPADLSPPCEEYMSED